ncbi:MAG: PKD domain-containing protein [Bradymonadia bacterium]
MPSLSKLSGSLAGVTLLIGLIPGVVQAEPILTMQAPVEGSCVGNDDEILGTPPLRVGEVFEGAVSPNGIVLSLTLEENEGQNVLIEIFVDEDINDAIDPVEVFETTITPFQFDRVPGEPYQALIDDLAVPADLISDGDDRLILVRATNDDGDQDEAQTTVRIDRAPPFVYLADQDFDLLDQCYQENAPDLANLPIQVIDEQDPNPIVQQSNEVIGCVNLRTVTVTDNCGNTQDIELRVRTNAVPPQISIEGIEEGAVLFGGALTYDVQSEAGCLEAITGTLTRGDDPEGVLIPGQEIDAPGAYVANVSVSACGEVIGQDQVSFTIAEFPELDLGGPYTISQGDALDIDGTGTPFPEEIPVEWAWDLDGDGQFDDGDSPVVPFDGNQQNGEYLISARVRAAPDRIAFAQTTVTIEDVNPTCVLAGPYEVAEGEAVQFDGSGSSASHALDPLSLWSWDFGDGQNLNIANQPRPRHAYDAEGEYQVTLTLNDIDSSCQATTTVTVVDARPTVQGAGPLVNPVSEGDVAEFSAGLPAPGSAAEPITGFSWNFGADDLEDQSGAALTQVQAIYPDDGTYTVTLTVSDIDSQTEVQFDIEVADLQPEPLLIAPLVAQEGEDVVLDARASRAGGAADPITDFRWNFGDGSPEVNGLEEDLVTHNFNEQGRYTITLTITDEDSSTQLQREIEILDAEPSVSCPPRFDGVEGEPLVITGCIVQGGGLADPIDRYEWTFGDHEGPGDPPLFVEDDTPDVIYTYADDGVYTARLTVYDEEDTGTSTDVAIIIENRDPVLEIEASTLNAALDTPITFTAHIDDAPGDVPRLTWEMGNGDEVGNLATHEYRYQSRGVYQVRATVDDGDGGRAVAELEIRVGSAPPIIAGPLEVEASEGEEVVVEYVITPALRDEGVYDAPLQVIMSSLPEGAVAEINGPPPEQDPPDDTPTRVTVRWTPSFTDAGDARIRLSARPPSGNDADYTTQIQVADQGTPILAATAGTAARGRVLLFQYGFDPQLQRETFTPWADVTVGQGTAGMAAAEDGSRLFVASPGTGGVAVVDLTGDTPVLARVVPTGYDTIDVVYGAGRVWALDARNGTVTIIDPDTLKVLRTVSTGIEGPVDMAWLPTGTGGLGSAHLAIVSPNASSLTLVNAARANAGLPNIVTDTLILGGQPQQLLADLRTGTAYIVDAKARRVQSVTIADPLPAAESVGLDFAVEALALADEGGVLAATDAGVYRIPDDGGEPVLAYDLVTSAILSIEEVVRAERGLALAEGNQIIHLSAGSDVPVLPGPAAGVRQLSAFIVPRQEAVR